MKRTIVFSRLANFELCEARDWYDEKHPGLGDEFMDEMDDLVFRMAENPEMYTPLHQGLRRGVMHRFPYILVCKVQLDLLTVVSVFHVKRRPSNWMHPQ